MLRDHYRPLIFVLFLVSCVLCNASQAQAAKKEETKEITLSAAGDCTLGVDTRWYHTFDQVYRQNNTAYFFKKVRPIFAKDDITLVNLEGTFTSYGVRANKTFTFKGPAEYAAILKKGSVEVVNLANNHSKNYGMTGFNDTKRTLRKNKIPYCYKNEKIAYKKVEGVKTAFIGFNQLDGVQRSDIKKAIKEAKKAKATIIVVSFHWGIEGAYWRNATQASLARYAIDKGASLVLGHHPHVLQGVEKYKGRYIVYSLGNFCFGGNTNPADKDTMIYQQTFYVRGKELLAKNNAKVIPCSLSSHSDHNDYQPMPLSGTRKRQVLDKIQSLGTATIKADGRLK